MKFEEKFKDYLRNRKNRIGDPNSFLKDIYGSDDKNYRRELQHVLNKMVSEGIITKSGDGSNYQLN